MVAMRYTVTAERGATGAWVLQCLEFPGAISETRSLAAASTLMREAIAFVADVDPSTVDISLQPALPDELRAEVEAARAAVSRLVETQRQTAELSRSAVQHLVESGLSGRDVSAILEISPQRVSQLVNA